MSGILRFCCDSARAQDHTLMTVSTFRSGVGGVGIQYHVGLFKKTCSKTLVVRDMSTTERTLVKKSVHHVKTIRPSWKHDPSVVRKRSEQH